MTDSYDDWTERDWELLDAMRQTGEQLCLDAGWDVMDIATSHGITTWYLANVPGYWPAYRLVLEDSVRLHPDMRGIVTRAVMKVGPFV